MIFFSFEVIEPPDLFDAKKSSIKVIQAIR